MFESLRWTFSPTRAVEAYKARKARGGSGIFYVITFAIRVVCALYYLGFMAKFVAAVLGGEASFSPETGLVFDPVSTAAGFLVSVPVLLVMLLCMKRRGWAILYALAIPLIITAVHWVLSDKSGIDWTLPALLFFLHLLFISPFYFFAEEGFSGARPRVFNRTHDDGEWKDDADDFFDAQLYGSSSTSFNMQSFHISSGND